MPDDLLAWRREFPILAHSTYLISNSLGAMPQGVQRRLEEYADRWNRRGVRAWEEEWWDLPVRVGDLLAPLVGAGAGEISMHPNVTLTEAVILSCFDRHTLRRGRTRIVCEELNFPSILYLLREWSAERGCELVLVPSEDGVTVDTQRMIDAIDEQTFLVPISHVLFKSSYVQDVRAIIEKAHRVGALVVLDAYQSVGIMPVNVRELEVDVLVGGVLKWLCGGPGGCFLYVRPDLARTLRPSLTGWFAHKDPFRFDPGPMEWSETSARFLNGTPPVPALYAAQEGPRIIREIGVERIRAKSIRQTELMIREADAFGLSVASPREAVCRGGTVTLDVPDGYAVSREMIDRNVLVDFREGAGIRISPHFYNTDEEAVGAVRLIREILDDGTYRRHRHRRSAVT